MTALANLKVRSKIYGMLGFMMLLILIVGLVAIGRLSAVNDRAADIRDNWLPSANVLGKLIDAVQDFRVFEARAILADSDTERQQMNGVLAKRLQTVTEERQAYEPFIARGTDDEKYMRDFDAAWADHLRIDHQFLSSAKPRDLFLEANRGPFQQALTALRSDLEFNVGEGKHAADLGAAIYSSTRLLLLCAIAIAIGLVIRVALQLRAASHRV